MPFDLSSFLQSMGRGMAFPGTPQTNSFVNAQPYYFGSGPTGQDAVNADKYYMPPATDNPESYIQLLSSNGGAQSGMSTSNAPISLLGPSVETPQTDLSAAGAGVGMASPYDYGETSGLPQQDMYAQQGYQQPQEGRFGNFAGSFLYGMGAALAANNPAAGVPAVQAFSQRAERNKLIKQKQAKEQQAIEAGVRRLEELGRPDLASLGRAGTVDIGTLLKMAMEPAEKPTPYTDAGKIREDVNRGLISPEMGDMLLGQMTGSKREIREDQNGVARYIDTGEPVFPQAMQGTPVADFETEQKLRKEYDSLDPVDQYNKIKGSYERVRTSAQRASSDTTGASDLAMIFNYMKMLDPGSVVRESEFKTAAMSGGFGSQIQNYVQQIANGKMLTPAQRAEFVRTAEAIYNESAQNLQDQNERFGGVAKQWGVSPERLLIQPEAYQPLQIGEARQVAPNVTIRKVAD